MEKYQKANISSLILIITITIFISCSKETDTIKIGSIIPLTGESAYWGENIKNGIELAVEEINETGGILNKQLKIIYEDTQSKPTLGTQAVSKLISIDNVQCIIGDVISSVILAVAPIVEKNKVVLLGFGESALITDAGDYIFRNWNSASSDAEITGNFASTKSKKMVVLSQNDAFGQSAKTLFVEQLKKNNVQIVLEEEYSPDQTDFRTILTKIESKEYDGVYMAGFHQAAIAFLRQYKEMNLKAGNFYGVSSWEEGTLIGLVKQNYPGKVFYGYPMPPDSTLPQVKKFVSSYINKYNRKPEILCDNGYDSVYMLKYGIETANSYNGQKIKDALYTLKNFEGASGTMSFDKNGDVHKPFGLKVITKNGAEWIK